MCMDAKKIIEKLRGEADRQRVSLYLSQSILAEFRKACGDVAPSQVMEEMMKDFIQSSKDPAPKLKKTKAVKKS